MEKDHCHTIKAPVSAEYTDRSSKFISYADPLRTVRQCNQRLRDLQKEHFKARHVCFAYSLGFAGEKYRSSDDGEPSGTAGLPIYNQILSYGYHFVFVAVVRYFGGIKLGTSGLIRAYKTAAKLALEEAQSTEIFKLVRYRLEFDYAIMGQLFNHLKKLNIDVNSTSFQTQPFIEIEIRESMAEPTIIQLKSLLLGIGGEAFTEEVQVPHLNIIRV